MSQKQFTDAEFNALPKNVKALVDQHEELLFNYRMEEFFQTPIEAGEEANVEWIKKHLKTGREIVRIKKLLHEADPENFTGKIEEMKMTSKTPLGQEYIDKAMKQLEDEEKKAA